jgi:hypothetical protein
LRHILGLGPVAQDAGGVVQDAGQQAGGQNTGRCRFAIGKSASNGSILLS